MTSRNLYFALWFLHPGFHLKNVQLQKTTIVIWARLVLKWGWWIYNAGARCAKTVDNQLKCELFNYTFNYKSKGYFKETIPNRALYQNIYNWPSYLKLKSILSYYIILSISYVSKLRLDVTKEIKINRLLFQNRLCRLFALGSIVAKAWKKPCIWPLTTIYRPDYLHQYSHNHCYVITTLKPAELYKSEW